MFFASFFMALNKPNVIVYVCHCFLPPIHHPFCTILYSTYF